MENNLIKKPHQITVPTVCVGLIYAPPGYGKTTLGASAPKPLLLDFDGGIHRLNPEHTPDVVQITSWKDIAELMTLKDQLKEYQTLIIDTAGKMVEFMGNYVMETDPSKRKKDGTLGLQGYGVRKAIFKQFLFDSKQMGLNVLFIAHSIEEKDGDTTVIRPEVGGSSGNDLYKEMDFIGFLSANGNERTLYFEVNEKFYTKNTANLPSKIPVKNLNSGDPNNLMGELFEYFKNKELKRQELNASFFEKANVEGNEYLELMEMIKDKVEAIVDLETVNEVMNWALSFTDWKKNAKSETSKMIAKKALDLNLVFNKKTSQYEPAPATV